MAEVTLRQKAIDDLSDIWNYTCDKWSEAQADRYYDLIRAACKKIGKHPELGKNYTGIEKNLLGTKAGKHIIFYQATSKNRIEVVRILHERMDLETRIAE